MACSDPLSRSGASSAGASTAVPAAAAEAATRAARSPRLAEALATRVAAEDTVSSPTSSMIAMGALSPLRGAVLMKRV